MIKLMKPPSFIG